MPEKVDFDQYIDNYNELLHEGTKFFAADQEYFARYKIELVRKSTTVPVKRILEFGCGIGRNIAYLAAAFPGAQIVGTDISEASLEIARKENPTARFEKDAAGLDGRFDLIFVAGVFHHIAPPERPAVMQLLANLLDPSGSLYVFEHNPYNPVTRRIVNNCPYDADAVLVKPAELTTLMRKASLKPLGHSYCLFVPPKLAAMRPIENVLGWLPLGGQYWAKASH